MLVKESKVFDLIEKMRTHYTKNIYNRYLRKALITMQIPQSTWDLLDSIAERADFFKVQGYQLDELYDRIIAAAQFIFHARKDVIPNLRFLLSGGGESYFSRSSGDSSTDKVLGEMAVKNFPVNLKIYSDLVNELYLTVAELDRNMNKNKTPVYEKIPELKQIGQYLVTEE
ncbi:MAG: hypothetical protein JW904_01495 [Spirochaetales bacterium]|nr:hypothetical protein [Spirochaetales bacterium]